MHAVEQVNVDLSGAIMRMSNTRNQLNTTGYPWASDALTATIQALRQIERENPQPSRDKITYTDVIGRVHTEEKMWLIGNTEDVDVGQFQFYVSEEGFVVYWFIDSTTCANIALQLDLALVSIKRCGDEARKQLQHLATLLVQAIPQL